MTGVQTCALPICTNGDGGGSSTMVLRDEDEKAKASFIVRNRPSDGSPRAVGNGLAIVEKD